MLVGKWIDTGFYRKIGNAWQPQRRLVWSRVS